MASRVKHHAHARLWLVSGEARTTPEGKVDGCVKIVDLDVEVEHLVLTVRLFGPGWCAVTGLGLERQARAARRVPHQHPVRFAARDLPSEKLAVEVRHNVRVSTINADRLETERR
jgi:hypothetical protein